MNTAENMASLGENACDTPSFDINDGFEFDTTYRLTLLCFFLASLFAIRTSLFKYSVYHRTDKLPVVPYTIPWVGSMVEYRSDAVSFLSHWSRCFKTNVFSMYMAGKVFIVVIDPVAASMVVNGRFPQLSWSHVRFNFLYKALGSSKDAATIFSKDRELHGLWERLMGNTKNLDKALRSYQKMIVGKIIPNLEEQLNKNECNGWINVNVLIFFGRIIYFGSIDAFLGFPSLANEEYFNLAMIYNRKFFEFFKTRILTGIFYEEYQAREEIVRHVKSMLSEPTGKATFSELVNTMIGLERYGLDDLARSFVLIQQASIFNAIPTMFWVVYYTLSDKNAYNAARNEVHTIFEEKTRSKEVLDCDKKNLLLNTFSISELNQMECIESIIMEVLRFRNTQKAVRSRIAASDFEMKLPINDQVKKISVKKGNIVITCPTLNHLDEEIFEDAHSFKWDRFLRKADGTLPVFTKNGVKINKAVDAFGGGATLCPGRRFAKAQMKLIMACMFLKYDMKFPGDEVPTAPDLREKSGISSGMPAYDISIQLRKRTVT